MSDAPAIVLLHGFTGSGASWTPVVSRLAERYRPIAPDIRGHASASNASPVTLEAVLADLELELSAVGVGDQEPFMLGGYSQGGRLALHAALHFGSRINRLVLIGATPGIADPDERAARRASDEALADEFAALTIEQVADRWASVPVLSGITGDQAQQARTERLRSTPDGLAAALRGLGAGALPSLWDRLGEITPPVSVISGERDQKFCDIGAEMVSRLPRARALVVPGAGHAVALERPDVIAQVLAAPEQ